MATTSKASSRSLDRDRRFVLHGIRWRTYEALLRDLEESHLRLTYDRGSLEIMAPGRRHERNKHKIGRLVEAMTEELNIPIEGGGSTLFRRKLKKRGLEPDECYWVEHEPQVRGYDDLHFDLETYPPPDIAIEIEISRSLLDKLAVYAGLGFPEIWRFDGKTLRVARLQPDGTYLTGDQSPNFPWLPLAELGRFLGLAGTTDETTWIRGFRAWVRDELAPRRAAGIP